jgi:hypothetical protein
MTIDPPGVKSRWGFVHQTPFCSERSAIFTIEWDLTTQTLATQAYQRTDL